MRFSVTKIVGILASSLAALMTTTATIFIFKERIFQGAWIYFLLIPLLYAGFSYTRQQLGTPDIAIDYLGRFTTAQLAGFGFGQTIRRVKMAMCSNPEKKYLD